MVKIMVLEDIVWIDIHYNLSRLMWRFGSYFYCDLKFHHIATSEITLKANHALARMKRTFYNLSNDAFLKLYNALVRPVMEYGNISYMGPTLFVG